MSDTEPKTGGLRVPRFALLLPLLVFLGLAAVFLARLLSGADPSLVPSALVDKPAPEFTLPPLDGLSRNGAPLPGLAAADLEGNVSVVNVFASWCAPCRQEHPFLEALAGDPRIRVFGINYKDVPSNAVAFLDELGNPYAAVGVDPRGRTAIDWGVYGVPETFVVDRDGIIRAKVIGAINQDNMAEVLTPAIDAALAGN